MFDPTADVVYADGPSGAPLNPAKALIRKYLRQFEASVAAGLSNGGLIYDTKTSMNADLAHAPNSSAWVMTGADAGIYRKSGASGSGSWAKIADLPYSFIKASNVDAGDPAHIVATTSVPVPVADGAALIVLNITATNTGATDVRFNNDAPLRIKQASGIDVDPGHLKAGMVVQGYKVGGTFQLLDDFGAQLLTATSSGGTENAVRATTPTPVPPWNGSALIFVPFTAANTGAMTLSINGEVPRALVTNTGAAIPPGYTKPGMAAIVHIDDAGRYRFFSYGDASAVQAAAEAAMTLAQKWSEGTAPGGAGTKSAKEWADVALAAGVFNIVAVEIVGDGITNRFPLGIAPQSKNNVFLTATGLVQHVGEYNVDGTDLVFAVAPPIGYGGEARILAITRAVPYVGDGTVNPSAFSEETSRFIGGTRGNITPAVEGNAVVGTATYITRRGQWRLVNDWVNFSVEIDWTGATGTGDMFIRLYNAPVSAFINTPVSIQASTVTYVTGAELQGVILAGTNVVLLQARKSGEGSTAVPVDPAGTIRIVGGYPAASDAYSDILFMGDSITLGVRPGVEERDTFRQKVQNALGWAMAHNAGVGGENASEQEARMAAALAASGARSVCIMTGINDFFDPLPYATMGAKITSMITMAQAAGARVTLCSPTATQDAGMIANFGPWLNTIQTCGALPGVVYVPVYEKFMILRATMPPAAYAALFVDVQHIGPTGHDVVTALIRATPGACRP